MSGARGLSKGESLTKRPGRCGRGRFRAYRTGDLSGAPGCCLRLAAEDEFDAAIARAALLCGVAGQRVGLAAAVCLSQAPKIDQAQATSELSVRQRRRSLVVLLTNIRDEDSDELLAAVQLLKQRRLANHLEAPRLQVAGIGRQHRQLQAIADHRLRHRLSGETAHGAAPLDQSTQLSR